MYQGTPAPPRPLAVGLGDSYIVYEAYRLPPKVGNKINNNYKLSLLNLESGSILKKL